MAHFSSCSQVSYQVSEQKGSVLPLASIKLIIFKDRPRFVLCAESMSFIGLMDFVKPKD